ncbi:hypothetical protein Zmor_016788 [Zophobas morio]|uniref:Uncharacterized protein n=1 Tax=Zophobas morio TaxID=2755281 RepID=A0AA38MBZ5_9CUCU|nr:hypothetical protein Zmor_016788 [Zophobas morio]
MSKDQVIGIKVQGLSTRIKVQGSRYKDQGTRIKVQRSRYKNPGAAIKVQGSRFKVQGTRIKVEGSRYKDQGPRIKVERSRYKNQGRRIKVQESMIKVEGSRSKDQGTTIKYTPVPSVSRLFCPRLRVFSALASVATSIGASRDVFGRVLATPGLVRVAFVGGGPPVACADCTKPAKLQMARCAGPSSDVRRVSYMLLTCVFGDTAEANSSRAGTRIVFLKQGTWTPVH